jgi:hypothetical protein
MSCHQGFAKLGVALASAVALAQTKEDLKTDGSTMAAAARDLRYYTARRVHV